MAEIELSILSRQCLDRQIPDQDTLKKEVVAWQEKRNIIASPLWNGDLPRRMLGYCKKIVPDSLKWTDY